MDIAILNIFNTDTEARYFIKKNYPIGIGIGAVSSNIDHLRGRRADQIILHDVELNSELFSVLVHLTSYSLLPKSIRIVQNTKNNLT